MMEVWLATRALIRLAGRTVQAIGVCLLAGSVAGLTGSGLSEASGYFATVVAQVKAIAVPAPSASPVPSPIPSPSPSPSPTPGPRTRRGGPLDFSLNGSLSLGENGSSTTRTDAFGNPIADGTTTASSAVGLFAELRRRTATSTADLKIPLGFSTTGTQFGEAVISFSTPHFELLYGGQTLNLFGQVPIGTTLRGLTLVIPISGGDMAFLDGSGIGVDQEHLRVEGVRGRRLAGRNLYEFGFVRNQPGLESGTASTLFFGVAGSRGNAAFVGEIAAQKRQTPQGPLGGVAAQLRIDYGALSSGWTATFRHTPERFFSYGGGDLFGDNMVDVGYRAGFGDKNVSSDIAYESTFLGGTMTRTRRSFLSYGGMLGRVTYQATGQESRTANGGPTVWTGGLTFQVAAPVANGFALLGMQTGRTLTDGGSPASQLAFSGQFQRQIGQYAFSIAAQRMRQANSLFGASHTQGGTFGVVRQFGRTGLGYTYAFTHSFSGVTDAYQRTPQFSISRQLSPALSVQASFGTQTLDDRINPLNSGRSRVFTFTINAPFAFGNGVVAGRIDPNLPAIVAGRVLADLGDNSVVAGLAPGGVANIIVVLDGTEAQRTDLDGNFQFSFVKPGQHQLRLESASLPRGLTADQPVVTLNLQGGQTGQVYFRVGDFGGIGGHVFGRDSNGGQMPLSGVLLRVDGGAYSQTDQQGSYGFGRLSPGPHTVTIVENSVPAFASFPQDRLSQKIVVRDGEIAPVDFVASPLGSIAGFVKYDTASLGKGYTGGVANAYVVAEPGEHAAITDYDGSFIIDNLPAGVYSVSVDPETVPDQTGPLGNPLSVTLVGTDHYQGAAFSIGQKQKNVVFTFLANGATAASVHLNDSVLPPLGTTTVAYTAPPGIQDAVVKAFGKSVSLAFDAKASVWRGTIAVPAGTAAGSYDVVATATGISSSATAQLRVDPKMSIAIMQTTPSNVAVGQYVAVRARFLVDVRAGDTIQWSDGTITTLGKPVAGRVFTFSLRVTLRPLYGVLLTRDARLPIRLL
jgi:hypothetical protein